MDKKSLRMLLIMVPIALLGLWYKQLNVFGFIGNDIVANILDFAVIIGVGYLGAVVYRWGVLFQKGEYKKNNKKYQKNNKRKR